MGGAAQVVWEQVLALATDAEPPPAPAGAASPALADPGSAAAAAVRRHAVVVMDAVDRSGLVAPWTAVPHLVALTTDPNACAPPRPRETWSCFWVQLEGYVPSLCAWRSHGAPQRPGGAEGCRAAPGRAGH